ncbi:hypothetical protein CYLTODRAFT_376891 [Cylindrobasidium torrendii FP15055 ss-10]|uniref:Calcium-channel protein CCH1 n=1 Tax=Cylindrobasidium torrendii FP15055 ss-10 TaxID=1314674 RepID=A0A0D7BBW4_9AGAR|nr:hypothetical protein CYLTODRAFT_376891 [Cylindrobasidium torrendii FP15055 ss-10]
MNISRSSSTSAVDLSVTTAGRSAPQSPSLDPPQEARRRSWSKVDDGQDPLSIELRDAPARYTVTDDPFDSDDTDPYAYSSTNGRYATMQAGPSTATLIRQRDSTASDADDVHLTAGRDGDPEATVTPRRRTLRYSASPSPLRRTGTAIKSVSQGFRRMSLRVVNLANSGLERLDGDDGVLEQKEEDLPDLRKEIPIRGRTLCCLGPDSIIRLALYRALVYPLTEIAILLCIILNAVVLTIQAAPSLHYEGDRPPRVRGFFHEWEDYVLFGIFIFYTLEAIARICVSGFLFDPEVPASSIFHMFSMKADHTTAVDTTAADPGLSRQYSLSRLNRNMMRPFILRGQTLSSDEPKNTVQQVKEKAMHAVQLSQSYSQDSKPPTFIAQLNPFSSRKSDYMALPFQLSVRHATAKTARNIPYLRHSWSRIDLLAIVGFWTSFILATLGVEHGSHHIGIFRAFSVLRTARLLTVTTGTTTIMHSLKTALPLLTSVAYFVLFAMILFSIIGIQSFQGSLRRTCFLTGTQGVDEIQLSSQFCGGYINPENMTIMSYIDSNGDHGPTAKGYICPLGLECRVTENPEDNVQSFDTIYYAALQVVVVASANGWTPLMYSMIDSEYFVSALFFIICIIILNFWLINLFVAVITNTFSAIRKETSKSAFGAGETAKIVDDQEEWQNHSDPRHRNRQNLAKTIYDYTEWCWVLLALVSLTLQATRTVEVSDTHEMIMYFGELAITIAFDAEIVLRIIASLPDWRNFFWRGRNNLDLFLVIGTSIIQIPVIKNSAVYPWMTVLQLMRFYRVILVVPRMKPLLLTVFGNVYGLTNMTLFLITINYVAALFAVQLLRGDFAEGKEVDFAHLYNAFLCVYQVFSSENWTDVLYGASGAGTIVGQTVVVVLFVSLWMLFANFIVMQMFIAVINENFDVAEESKKGKQVSNYYATTHDVGQIGAAAWMRKLNPYRWVRADPVKVKVENLPSDLILPMQKSFVQDYSAPQTPLPTRPGDARTHKGRHYANKSLKALHGIFAGTPQSQDVPLATIKTYTKDEHDADDEETERHLELLASLHNEAVAPEVYQNENAYERRAQKADFIRDHPTYDKTFWIFSQKNILRKAAQKLVMPANGERIFGTPQSPVAHTIFQLLVFLTVIAGLIVEIIASPLYRREYWANNGDVQWAWFDIAEIAFGFTLLLEFLIKICADGFLFTPNAYARSIWNLIDLGILAGLLVNVVTGLIVIGGVSRLTRSLKALRVLRFVTLFDATRKSFQSLIISGAARIMDAAVLAMLYMIPYAVWGLNIFVGKLNRCNDDSVAGQAECVGEYTTNVLDDNNFGFIAPRVWDNPAPSTKFSFDTFKASLLILFEIVSLEGWIDAMWVASAITGPNLQPETNASQVNALFFLIYNLLGGVIILTLFVSIIIGNFRSKTGTALLTGPQREWIDLKKLITRQRPSKRPQTRPTWAVRAWCYDRAVHKHGWWARGMLFLYVLHVIALMTQTYTNQAVADTLRNDFFLVLTVIYLIDVCVRFFGMGWRSFRSNGWNLFDIVSSVGTLATTLIVRFQDSGFAVQQLQKLFLVSISFKLVQRTNSLNKLFKTVMASLVAILNLLVLWIIFFMFFAILYVEVFGLTKWGSGENWNMNYSSVANALVMLSFMSTGEGWNQYMHDYAVEYPRCTNTSANHADSDCGSVAWAFTLFIAWNVMSMYIFLNLFTGVVVENFSYVFQTSGGAKSITREEMRSFKKVWAEFANPKTGYLERNRFAAFFSRLSGVFEVRIYPPEYRVQNVLAATRTDEWSKEDCGVDIAKLSKVLDQVDYAAIQKRKALYSRVYHEASVTHNGLGISFTGMLTLLAHHKLIVDHEALVLHDLVARTHTNKLVTDLVNLDRVRSLLRSISYRRRFLKHLESKRRMERAMTVNSYSPDMDIPSIVVDQMPTTPPPSTRDIASLSMDGGSLPGSPSPSQQRFYHHSPDVSLASGMGLQRSSRRISDISMLGTSDFGAGRNSTSSMLSTEDDEFFSTPSTHNSMWGDLLSEAVREEENR